MEITDVVWDEQNKAHIARHQVTPAEVEELLLRRDRFIRKVGRVYHAFGQAGAGRYLFVVLRLLGQGRARVVTAREMSDGEKRFYRQRRG